MSLRYFPLIDEKPNTQGLLEDLLTMINIVDTPEQADLLLVAGGDGYMLDMIKKNIQYNKPFFGLNYGTLGFLLNPKDITLPQERDDVNLIQEKLPEATITSTEGEITKTIIVNDAVLGNSIFDYFKFTIKSQNKEFETRGTGLIASTSLGSTAYRCGNGGPIFSIGSQLLGIMGIAARPYRFEFFENQPVTIERDSRGRYQCHVGIDGYGPGMIQNAQSITIEPAKYQMQLAFHKDVNFEAKRLTIDKQKLLSARTK